MKHVLQPLAILVLGLGLTSCTSQPATSPSPGSTETFMATLLPANEVPPITNNEAGGSATAIITFNLTKDSGGYVTATSMDISATVTGFPSGTVLTKAHIHPGATGSNGGVFVNVGLADGEVRFPSGSGSFSKTGIALTVDQANAILSNPSAYYFNIHTAANPDGVARGQLTRAQ